MPSPTQQRGSGEKRRLDVPQTGRAAGFLFLRAGRTARNRGRAAGRGHDSGPPPAITQVVNIGNAPRLKFSRTVDPARFPFPISSYRMPPVPRAPSRLGGLQIRVGRFDSGSRLQTQAAVAQLVERNLAKVEVESSRLFCRSSSKRESAERFPFFASCARYNS